MGGSPRKSPHHGPAWVAALLSALFTCPSFAELCDRGGGLICDDVLDVTWLQDANGGRMRWEDAVAWAEGLSYHDTVRGITWDDWRLPHALPVNGVSYNDTFSYDGTTDHGYNVASPESELGYMFYVNLGILGYADPQGHWPQPGFGFRVELSGPFTDMDLATEVPYWTGTEYPPFDGMAYVIPFQTGYQHGGTKETELLVWAVRDGDVAVVPAFKPAAPVSSPCPE